MPIKFKNPEVPAQAMNLTSLIDVIFLLLVFFLLTSTFQNPALKVNLPQANLSLASKDSKTITVSVSNTGEIFLNSEQVDKLNLKEKLVLSLENSKDKALALKADKLVNYASIFEIIEIAKKAGVENFNLLYEEK